jgi:hypothetical protein
MQTFASTLYFSLLPKQYLRAAELHWLVVAVVAVIAVR